MLSAPVECPASNCQCDTENINTVVFEKHYRPYGLHQHGYEYRYAREALENPSLSEWNIEY
jgi:hypothetical protein